ncbi:MAG: GGDEF domain-containing protein [Lachnospiraceae bacterium]|nr:GGDEF domain-containing protein [Lachnospiraceae bacterium]
MNASIFDEIINSAQDCIFWKDKERRFVGVNRAFLDFYGFESDQVLIGKTDEDMGWHNDPEPYRQDELRVLNGESTYKVPGKCIIRGQERDIIASKRPLWENGEVIGLVGSFMDVTEVTQRKAEERLSQILYDTACLRRFSYFDKLLDEVNVEEILDPLCGIVSRGYMIDFTKNLMAAGIPFTFSILDLDNFKGINDTYGHGVGDKVLMKLSKDLASYSHGSGIVGRFGGDELLLIDLVHTQPSAMECFLKGMYDSNVLRKNITVDPNELYLTGTLGCALFPDDADKFDDLFNTVDKMLYFGKRRGRNCYMIYHEDIDNNIDARSPVKAGIFSNMLQLTEILENVTDISDMLTVAAKFMEQQLGFTDLFFSDLSGKMICGSDPSFAKSGIDIGGLCVEDSYTESSIDSISKINPDFGRILKERNLSSVIIMKIRKNAHLLGYLICATQRLHRIWQDDEYALVYYLSQHLANIANREKPAKE